LLCHEKKPYGKNTFSYLKKENDKRREKSLEADEFFSGFVSYKFKGQAQNETPAGNIRQLQKLLMLLPGESGRKYRDIAESTVTRVLAGDQTLKSVIDDNFNSNEDINKIARDTLEKDKVDESNNEFLLGKIDILSNKINQIKIKNKELKVSLKNKDMIIEENRIELRNIISTSNNTINILTNTNNSLTNRNETLSNRNTLLINN